MIPKEKIQETPLKTNKINNEITKEQLQEAIRQSQQKKNEQGVTHIEENHKNTKITNKHQIIQENNLLYMEDMRSGKRVQIIPWQDKELIATILQCYHDEEQAGHPGVKRTMELITRELYWKTMIQDVKQHIKECIKCQQNKPIRKKRTEITQAIQIPTRPWEIITYDLIGPLPLSNKYDGIMVIVDKHSKYLELLPIQMNYDNQQILKLLEDNIFKRYGYPTIMISDRDPRFLNKNMQEVAKSLNIDMRYSTAYHPQTDGQTERANQEVEIYLRHYVQHHQENWADKLTNAQIALNNRINDSTKQSAFRTTLGYDPRFEIIGNLNENNNNDWLQQFKRNRQIADNTLQRRYNKIQQENKNKRYQNFKIGERVWLDNTNIKLNYPKRKLEPKRLGRFKIIKK